MSLSLSLRDGSSSEALGHLVAVFTIIVWGVTFISTKILLASISPFAILFIRFLIGWLFLFALAPRRIGSISARQRLVFAGAGFSGVTLYFLMENIALEYTYASNVAIIVSLAPFFTVILARIFLEIKRPGRNFFAGFALAMLGIIIISLNPDELEFNLAGDVLALLAALAWGFYSVFTQKLAKDGFDSLLSTRIIFFYGLLFMLPILPFWPLNISLSKLLVPVNLFNLLFLGLGASALCFASWTYAIKRLGVARSSLYIYLVPGVTVIAAAIFLNEEISLKIVIGIILTIGGLLLAERDKAKIG